MVPDDTEIQVQTELTRQAPGEGGRPHTSFLSLQYIQVGTTVHRTVNTVPSYDQNLEARLPTSPMLCLYGVVIRVISPLCPSSHSLLPNLSPFFTLVLWM